MIRVICDKKKAHCSSLINQTVSYKWSGSGLCGGDEKMWTESGSERKRCRHVHHVHKCISDSGTEDNLGCLSIQAVRRLITRIDGGQYLFWLPSLINTSHYSGAAQGGRRRHCRGLQPRPRLFSAPTVLSISGTLFFQIHLNTNNPSDPHETSICQIKGTGFSCYTHLPVLHLLSEIPATDQCQISVW